jgi:c-di-GMP-related signal transduction protein
MVNFGKIHIVIDALDECTARTDLLSLIEDLTTAGCSLLATSRKEEDIESELERWLHQDNIILIQQDAVNDDIRMYVRRRLRNDRGFERWLSR